MIYDLFTSGFFGITLGILLVISTLFLIVSLTYLTLYFINSNYTTPLINGRGIIVRKNYEVGDNNKVVFLDSETPTIKYCNELWTVIIRVNNKEDEVEVSEEDYHRYEVGEQKNIQYVVGKLWKAVFIKKILDY